jgi:fumarate reductase (CoM/CoB) subunit A
MTGAKSSYKTDILIIGGGGSAAIAALEAKRLGVRPLLVCKDTFLGGATVQASGGTSIPFLEEDSAEAFIADTLSSGGFVNNRLLVKTLAEEARETFYELEQNGLLLDRSRPGQIRAIKRSEGHSFMRSYSDRRQTHGIVNFLKRRVLEEEIPLLEERMLVHLFVNEGRIEGGLFFSLENGEFEVISARVVVLATGGCGQLFSITTNANCLTGEGYALAFHAGAEMVDMEMIQFLPLAFPYPNTIRGAIMGMCSLFGPKVKLYNGLNERYMERYAPGKLEFATRDLVARANYLEIQEGRGTRRGTIIVDPTGNDPFLLKDYRESSAVIYGMIGETFGEKAANWEVPFEAIPSQHFMMGGVKIDENGLTSVQSLLCCGEITGGVHGANRLSGNALTEIYVFGKRAGRKAVERISFSPFKSIHPKTVQPEISKAMVSFKSSDGIPPSTLKRELQKVMWDHVGIVRDGGGLKTALKRIQTLKRRSGRVYTQCKEKHWNRQWLESLEVPLMLETAELIAISALSREESRGSHYRRDFSQTNPLWLRNVVLKKDSNDAVRVTLTPVSN